MKIKKFNQHMLNMLNESNSIDNININKSINELLVNIKSFVWDNISRYDNDIKEQSESKYQFNISYDVISETEYIEMVYDFIEKNSSKYNISKIDKLSRGVYLYFTDNNETYSIPLILTMSAGGMIYSNDGDHRVKYGVWLNMNVLKKYKI